MFLTVALVVGSLILGAAIGFFGLCYYLFKDGIWG
jgi:hypothetical protein